MTRLKTPQRDKPLKYVNLKSIPRVQHLAVFKIDVRVLWSLRKSNFVEVPVSFALIKKKTKKKPSVAVFTDFQPVGNVM